jgi:hypothetical protein
VHDSSDYRGYRRGRAVQWWQPKPRSSQRREVTAERRRERYAIAIARAEFGRFYWSDERDSEFKAAITNTAPPTAGRRRGRT